MKTKLKKISNYLIISILFISFACGGAEQGNEKKEEKTAENKEETKPEKTEKEIVLDEVDLFYNAIIKEEFEKALDNLHPVAVRATPKKDWLKILLQTNEKFGKLVKHKAISEKITEDFVGSAGKGNYYQFIFKNTYEKGIDLYEKVLFVKEKGADKPLMLGYNYNVDSSKVEFEKLEK
jgi:hypothetical protein